MARKLQDHTQTATYQRIVGKAIARYQRVAPRKVRFVVDLIRGKTVEEAFEILRFCQRPSAVPTVTKVLKAAEASAREVHPEPNRLVVREAIVNEAPMLKRIRPAAMGRAVRIRKRQSHVFLALTED